MRHIFYLVNNKFVNKHLDFRVRLFNILALGGTAIGILMTITSAITNVGLGNLIANPIIAVISFSLLYYSYKTGKYQICYMFTIVLIFLILFPVIFFTGGAYNGGMPSFFIFAVLFTVFMLDGKKMFIMTIIEMITYITICIIAFLFPQSVDNINTEVSKLADIIVGFSIVSISLGITMFLHFKLYNQQQKDLETARKEAENLSQAKTNFLANMSHEIRTPINVILGMNEMIIRKSNSNQVSGYALSIQKAGNTLLTIINNILDVSKIESGKFRIDYESYQTCDLIRDLSIVLEEQAMRYGLSFKLEINESIPKILYGDVVHIKQIATNFLSNASKYTKKGSVTLSLDQKELPNLDETLLCISVTDTGIGIKEDSLNLLFDAFMRADMPLNRYIEGTGLGLAISKELTELMNGQIFVESTWGVGSKFTVEIPQAVKDQTPIGKLVVSNTKKTQNQHDSFIASGCNILVVDDNEENQNVIKALLSHTLINIDLASSGEQCISLVSEKNYDLILMDYMMPIMNGLTTLCNLKNIEGFNTPVIVLTANVIAGVKEKLLSEGFSAYISKPIVYKELEHTLMSFLPKEKLTIYKSDSSTNLDLDSKNQLDQLLSLYDVSFFDGLHYLSGDIFQYKTLCSFFVDNYESGKNEIQNLSHSKNWTDLKFCVHSLKSKSLALGANDLSYTASKLEMLCIDKDENYILIMLPLLFYQWEIVNRGLCLFIEQLNNLLPQKNCDTQIYSIEQLLPLIKHNRQFDVLNILDFLISKEQDNKKLCDLNIIKQNVDDANFREAEKLILDFMEA